RSSNILLCLTSLVLLSARAIAMIASGSQEAGDLGGRGFDLHDDRFLYSLNAVRNTFRVTANVAGAENVNLISYRHLNFSLDDVGQGFVRMNMKGRADAWLVMNLQERHLIALDHRFDQQIAVHRFAFNLLDD